MNEISLFRFEETEIRETTDAHGEPWFVLRDLLDAMQSSTKTTDAVESITQGLGEGFVNDVPLQTAGGTQNIIIVSEPAATYLLSRSNTERGRQLNRFIHVEVLPSIRKTGAYQIRQHAPSALTALDAKLKIGQAASEWLRMSDTSKIRLLSDISRSEGIEPTFLPAYVDEPLTRAMTPLLKEQGSPLSAKVVNLALADMGLLERLTRQGRSGEKAFWSLTGAGLAYGRNETSPHNPRETQPLYFAAAFAELLERVRRHLGGEECHE